MFIIWMLVVDAKYLSFLDDILHNGGNLVELTKMSNLSDEPLLSQG